MSHPTTAHRSLAAGGPLPGLLARLNARWHRPALLGFLAIVLAHWAEHLLQAYQVYVLGTSRHQALGALGMLYPWLVHSEWLHFGYAVVMLVGLALLRPAFVGRGARWWTAATVIQAWHLVEHTLLFGQAVIGRSLWGAAAPTSVLQLVFPRIELHLFYNAVVFVPMAVAMVYHARPSPAERRGMTCSCVHAALVALFVLAAPAAGQTVDDALRVSPRQLRPTVEYGHDAWDEYWEGALRRTNGNIGTLTTRSVTTSVAPGVTDRLASSPRCRTSGPRRAGAR